MNCKRTGTRRKWPKGILAAFWVLIFCVGAQARTIKVGISLSDTRIPIILSLGEALKKEAEAAGMTVILLSAQSSASRQAGHIKYFLQEKVDFVILYPLSQTPPAGLSLLKEAGVPIITLENRLNFTGVSYHVETDPREAGRLAALYLALKSSRANPRYVLDVLGDMAASGPSEMNKWFDLECDNWEWLRITRKFMVKDESKAGEQISRALAETKSNVIFLPSEKYLVEVLRIAGSAWIIVTGGSPRALDLLAQGKVTAVIQKPVEGIARSAIENGRRLVFGNRAQESVTSLPPTLITKENLEWIRKRSGR